MFLHILRVFRYIIATLLLVCSFNISFANNLQQEITITLKKFPLTEKEIEQYKQEAIQEFKTASNFYKSQPKNQLVFDTTILQWQQIVERLVAKRTILFFTYLRTDDKQVIEKSMMAAQELSSLLQNACADSTALTLCLDYAAQVAENPNLLTPDKRYWLNTLISGAIEAWPELNPLRTNALKIQAKLASHPMTPFTYIQGQMQEKTMSIEQKIVIANWNVCMFDYGLSMLFGGILPWKDRIGRIVDIIQKTDADIICLQEVFSQEAATQFQSMLKNNYAHFYINIGPRLFGFDYEALGIASGLFVASKYPLKDPAFIPFNEKQSPKNRAYGFFTAGIKNKNDTIAHFTTTHLQPGSSQEDLIYREAQTEAILSYLRAVGEIPCFLCGDLNMEKKSKEFQKLQQNFIFSDSGIEWTCCELRNYWWKAGQDVRKFTSLGLDLEWIDYFLYLKTGNKNRPKMNTRVISVNNLKDPKTSLSDHQILLTTFSMQ